EGREVTTETDLPPSSGAAFTEALKGDSGSLDAWLEANDESEVAAHVEAYASACVARATAAKDAEIETLLAELDIRDSIIATHAADTREYQKRISQAEARADKLAEALKEIRSRSAMNLAMNPNPFELTAM